MFGLVWFFKLPAAEFRLTSNSPEEQDVLPDYACSPNVVSRQGLLGDAVMLHNRIAQHPSSSRWLSSDRNISLYKLPFGWIKQDLR